MTSTDYDARRVREEPQTDEQYLQLLTTSRRVQENAAIVETNPAEAVVVGPVGLDRLDLADELVVAVIAQQADEFLCSRCFVIQHRRRRASGAGAELICRDCATTLPATPG